MFDQLSMLHSLEPIAALFAGGWAIAAFTAVLGSQVRR